ncbi:hypothetical protein [Halalkalicoccus ordinarius]|uniref:hypothetical protein n=1 Tax=Halalkalicoccus ordinarius TaxID=3116651 RepID=UPI00300F5993
MGEDDEPAYGSNDVNDEDGQYGGTGDGGDDKRSAGAEGDVEGERTDDNGDDESDDDESDDDESLGQDETDPE